MTRSLVAKSDSFEAIQSKDLNFAQSKSKNATKEIDAVGTKILKVIIFIRQKV